MGIVACSILPPGSTVKVTNKAGHLVECLCVNTCVNMERILVAEEETVVNGTVAHLPMYHISKCKLSNVNNMFKGELL